MEGRWPLGPSFGKLGHIPAEERGRGESLGVAHGGKQGRPGEQRGDLPPEQHPLPGGGPLRARAAPCLAVPGPVRGRTSRGAERLHATLGSLGDSVTASARFMTGDRHHLRRDNAPVHAALTVQQFGAPKGMSPGPHLPRHLIAP